ncbi:MAG: GNAT family N-acetyltransferase [Jejuia sp.]
MNSKENYTVKLIDAKTTHVVRHPVLRTGKPIDTCIFSGDDLETTFHLGLYNKKDLIGVTSLMASENKTFQTPSQYQLRGMAILKAFQGKGLGAILISEGEAILKQKHVNLVWCNAREIAVSFYKRNGFKIMGVPFEIPEIGKHYMMHKYL